MRRSRFTFVLVLMILVSLFAASCSAAGEFATDANDILQVKNTITVQGTASITCEPTIAYVNIGVATFDKEASKAQDDNAEKMNRVYDALDGLGIAKEKIKTVSYYIYPRYDYDYDDNTSDLIGYDVTNSIQVTVEDLDLVSKVLDMTVEEGVNQASSISFAITDQENEDKYLEALAIAVKNAEAKATALAAASGVTVDKPLQIIEGSETHAIPLYSYAADAMMESAGATPISGGELKVVANVTLVYSY